MAMSGFSHGLTASSVTGRKQTEASRSGCFRGTPLLPQPRRVCRPLQRARQSRPLAAQAEAGLELPLGGEPRLRLNNIGPQPGSRRPNKRKGRGHAAGQGGSCGYGTKGQKSRSGGGIRLGFEGGQTPLYRSLPKLKGIAGGMSAGLPKFVTVNVSDLNAKFAEGEEVSLEALRERRVLRVSGREARLPLKVLGDGRLKHRLTVSAAQFSAGAREKIEAAGGTAALAPQRPKWTKSLGKRRKAEAAKAEAAGKPAPRRKSSTKAERRKARHEAVIA